MVMKIQGGLGNQMFQWACIRNIALRRNILPIIDCSFYTYDKKRTFQLDGFKQIKTLFDKKKVIINNEQKSLPRIGDDFKTFNFPEITCLLDGYWQSERFFVDITEIIKKDFSLDEYSYLLLKYPQIETSVSIHIRRDDYISSNGYHPVLPISYYEEALSHIDSFQNIFVFSDDLVWCKQNLQFKNCIFVEDCNEFETLYLMTMAKNNIIANSSFSWWGAWLNTKKSKVVAPKRWFGAIANIDASNITPKNWLLI